MDLIKHDDVIGLLCITMLVYDYGKTFSVNQNVSLEEYMKNPPKLETESKSNALDLLCKRTPNGIVRLFLDDAKTDLQAGITISEERKTVYVVFRGSESLTDWMHDFSVVKTKLGDDGVKVHSGFYNQLFKTNAFDKLKSELQAIFGDDKYNDYELVITGHSLGASLATLFGYLICDSFVRTRITIVSFASPRVGNYKWKNSFDSKPNLKHYRITNKRDVVTVCPSFRYHHVGINICLHDNRVKIQRKYPTFEKTIFNCWSVKEHFCDLYFDRLLKNDW